MPNKIHNFSDDIEQNFWPISKISRDFSSFNYTCAKVAYKNIVWVKISILKFVEDIDKSYMKDEVIELKSRIIDDSKTTKDELIHNWESYLNEGPGKKYKLSRIKPKKSNKK
jgi:hypothetical protein